MPVSKSATEFIPTAIAASLTSTHPQSHSPEYGDKSPNAQSRTEFCASNPSPAEDSADYTDDLNSSGGYIPEPEYMLESPRSVTRPWDPPNSGETKTCVSQEVRVSIGQTNRTSANSINVSPYRLESAVAFTKEKSPREQEDEWVDIVKSGGMDPAHFRLEAEHDLGRLNELPPRREDESLKLSENFKEPLSPEVMRTMKSELLASMCEDNDKALESG
eukprot:CAMPEP_0184502196 /NCGR_PEP_ID=MMETSP0113_2-20130426/49611_1 /TAXON_ID=91329 /ORGANISM="Norrisiella sphaerica, Strain BC52" /LENGTH=217 /DNA_ID=CAMNT_0026891249 /DNA_START=538 /DNA_END=1191 /DNA_ORIENTATION=-